MSLDGRVEMSATDALLREPVAQAIGWALLQFVWQGALIGLLTAAALAALRRSAADIRYVVATIGLTLMLTMPVTTAVQTWRASAPVDRDAVPTLGAAEDRRDPSRIVADPRPRVTPGGIAVAGVSLADAGGVERVTRAETWAFTPWLPALFLGWLVGVAILTLRLLSGWLWVQRLRSHCAGPASASFGMVASRLARRLHIRRTVTFLESALVEVPTVIGWLRPVVLVPASALAGLSPAQLEAVLAHELAHIRRHDYLVNLLQTLVETLLFYHPAVWWLSRRIRIEREHCCDDLAVSLCGDPVTYARALADLETLRGGGPVRRSFREGGRFALAANGGSLLDRVRRLLTAPPHAGRGPGWLAASVSVLVIGTVALGAIGTEIPGTEQSGATTAAPATAQPPTAPIPPAKPAVAESKPVMSTEPMIAAAAALEAEARALEMSVRAEEASAMGAQQSAAAAASQSMAAMEASVAAKEAALAGALTAWASTADQSAAAAEASVRAAEAALAGAHASQSAAVAEAVSALSFAGVAQAKGNITWSNNGEKLSIGYEGTIEFTDDDSDVKSLSPGGWLKIKEGGLLSSRTVEFRADASGRIERRYWEGISERPFEPEGRQWLARALPRFIRQTGLGAAGRVTRIFSQKGPDGVLAEIGLIEGSWAKRIYFTELLKQDKLEPAVIARVLQSASQLESDFELASLLIASSDRLLVTDDTRKAFFDAARSIGSDFEMRRVFSSSLKRGPFSPDVLASLLDASSAIGSDFEAASLLIEVAKLQPLDGRTRPAFFTVLGTVGSDFEHRRVLAALLTRGDQGSETRAAILESAAQIDSDFEKASLLRGFLNPPGLDDGIRPSFFRVVETLGSPHERSRVLLAVLENGEASSETVLAVLRATEGMKANFEASRVLLAIAARYPLSGDARERYITVAERLGEFEQGRVLAALVKSERRK
jgi:beta-lactamase regulating signal transducer with metallopeptidase domain